jgi:hypothetical protein
MTVQLLMVLLISFVVFFLLGQLIVWLIDRSIRRSRIHDGKRMDHDLEDINRLLDQLVGDCEIWCTREWYSYLREHHEGLEYSVAGDGDFAATMGLDGVRVVVKDYLPWRACIVDRQSGQITLLTDER